ncbi:hypothetical protein ACQJBY_069308 [Aegilops geniculata]
MASVPVLSKILLDAMLEKVGPPTATYSASPTDGTRLRVTVTFYPIKIRLRGSPTKVSLSTSEHQDLEIAQFYVAAAAIKYMDAYEGEVPKDYHYDQLMTVEKANVLLGQQLKAMKRDNASLKQELKESITKNKPLSKGWDGSLGTKQNIVNNLKHLVNSRLSPGSTPDDLELNNVLLNVEASCEYLQRYTDEAMVNLQETGVYPYGQGQSIDEDEDLPTQSDENPPYDPEMRTSLDDEQVFDSEGYYSNDFRVLPEDHF